MHEILFTPVSLLPLIKIANQYYVSLNKAVGDSKLMKLTKTPLKN